MIKPQSRSEIAKNSLGPSTSKVTRIISSNRLKSSSSQRPVPLDLQKGTTLKENNERSTQALQPNQSEESVTNPVKESCVRKSSSAPLRITLQPGQCIVLGRKPNIFDVPSEVNIKVTPVTAIKLPGTFTHASRTHVWCTLIEPPLGGLTLKIVVKGQNGLMVDDQMFPQGESRGIELSNEEGEQIELGFWGGKRVECLVKLGERPILLTRPRTSTITRLGLIAPERFDETRVGKRKSRNSCPIAINTELECSSSYALTPSGINLLPRSATSELQPSSRIKPSSFK
ncbi:hypothetical protein DFH28DRAFT_207373 [Melampsora americana]|nr:hypothetical protein DFH28DRAFT_207373 [Melampsora americana]